MSQLTHNSFTYGIMHKLLNCLKQKDTTITTHSLDELTSTHASDRSEEYLIIL